MRRLPDPSFWAGKKVLVTGHSGFVGGWTVLWLEQLGAEVLGLGLRPDEEPSLYELAGVAASAASQFIDISDRSKVATLLEMCELDIVLHLAAVSHVGQRGAAPRAFTTNVMGAVNLLDCLARQPRLKAVLVVTSPEVYGPSASPLDAMGEDHPLAAADLQSASRAASELIVAGYRESTFRPAGVQLGTARGGSIIGGGDFGRPDWSGPPTLIRPWQHVLDSVAGYLVYLESLADEPAAPPALNFGPAPGTSPTTAAALAEIIGYGMLAGWTAASASAGAEPVRSLWLDTRLARDAIGFESRLAPHEAAEWTAQWQRAVAGGTSARTAILDQIAAYAALP